jgi:hypothetical protein
MCNEHCQHPEKLKGTPSECTPEQIKECHGEGAHHTCGEKGEKSQTPFTVER